MFVPQVLLPPRTANIYSHLLKVEASELAKDRAANWERILEIRHLKDRMIRKCTRLGRAAVPKDKPAPRVMFPTLDRWSVAAVRRIPISSSSCFK